MGLIRAAIDSFKGVMADQWKEFFECDAMPDNVLAVKGRKTISGRSSNTKGSDDIITNGSVIVVADGQCMMIVDQGQIVEFSAVPGPFIYDSSTEPSVFEGGFGKGILESFKTFGKRFTFGGEPPKDQRVYFFNTKEIKGNKYGTPNPIPFRVVDKNIGLDVDISISCHGEYSYKMVDPILFYKNVCGNFGGEYTRQQLDSQLKSEVMTALQPAFAKVSAKGIRYSELPGHTMELSHAMNEVLSQSWKERRGLAIEYFGVSSAVASKEDEKMIRDLQSFSDPTRAAAHLVGAQAEAMKAAAANQNAGPAMAFMGMNMAGNAGGASAQNLFQMGQMNRPAAPQPVAEGWTCSCGATATGKFCNECGKPKPAPKPAAAGWTCSCGATANGKFCPECGKPKPADNGWTCSCGAVNKGKFCQECGNPKPAGIPQYRCDKCGWEPADPKNPPRFCPECGDPFDAGDIK